LRDDDGRLSFGLFIRGRYSMKLLLFRRRNACTEFYERVLTAYRAWREQPAKDDVLDNITLYWLTNTAVSSARLYWENKLAFFDVKNIPIPVAVSVFPDEIYAAPRSWTERAYPRLIHYNKLDKGGHFAAWEQPALFTAELRTAFRSLRQAS
jgi:pimeloyl-ACP methyl ester carboxylesterase